jgi:hypothetical protein
MVRSPGTYLIGLRTPSGLLPVPQLGCKPCIARVLLVRGPMDGEEFADWWRRLSARRWTLPAGQRSIAGARAQSSGRLLNSPTDK